MPYRLESLTVNGESVSNPVQIVVDEDITVEAVYLEEQSTPQTAPNYTLLIAAAALAALFLL